MTRCERCDIPVEVNPDRNDNARLMRRSRTSGLCANCAITTFIKATEPLASVLAGKGPDVLLLAPVQGQVAAVLLAGEADAGPFEINWEVVVKQWSLP